MKKHHFQTSNLSERTFAGIASPRLVVKVCAPSFGRDCGRGRAVVRTLCLSLGSQGKYSASLPYGQDGAMRLSLVRGTQGEVTAPSCPRALRAPRTASTPFSLPWSPGDPGPSDGVAHDVGDDGVAHGTLV